MTLRFASVVGSDTSLLNAAIAHYRDLGVESFHIARHVDTLDDPDFRRSVDVLERQGLSFAAVHQGPWDEDLNGYLIRAQMRKYPEDWWVVADLDEFHVYDRPLSEIVELCEESRCDYVRGAMLDRVAVDGSLVAVDPARSVWDQFELAGLVTLRVLQAATSKVTLIRGSVQLHVGQHWALSGRPLPATRAFAQVHHFKWTESVRTRLTNRVSAYASGDWHLMYPAVTEESRRILEHLRDHGGRIDVGAADLVMRRCGHAYTDYEPWQDLVPLLSLRNGLRPEAAPPREDIAKLLDQLAI